MHVDERVTAVVSVCKNRVRCGFYFEPWIEKGEKRACERLFAKLGLTGEHVCKRCSFSEVVPLRIEINFDASTCFITVPIYHNDKGVDEALEAMDYLVGHVQKIISAESLTRAIRDFSGKKLREGVGSLRQVDGMRIRIPSGWKLCGST